MKATIHVKELNDIRKGKIVTYLDHVYLVKNIIMDASKSNPFTLTLERPIFVVESETYYTEGYLEDFKECHHGEADLYSVRDDCLYYDNKYIGTIKGC